MHNEISDYLRMIDDADNAHSPWRRRDYADGFVDILRDIFTDDELIELAQAKAEGRLVVLPCKVGTRVWVIGQDCDLCHDMYTEEPCLFGDCEYRKVIESVFLPGMTDDIGKTVFLTREAAEKALGGAEG